MQWLELSVSTTHEAIEAVANILHEAGANGVVIEDPLAILEQQASPGGWDYVEIPADHDPNAEVVVKAYLQITSYIQDVVSHVRQAVQNLPSFGLEIGSGRVETAAVEDTDWATAWKAYYKPVRVGRHLLVKPIWEEVTPRDQDVIIELDPGLAFGTGTHPTTGMCLALLEQHVRKDDYACDVGCGSGVLSIAAAKLGAKAVIGVDIDELAVKISRENIGHNQLQDKITVMQGDLLSHVTQPADLVVANIVADVIIRLLPDIDRVLKPGGRFIASGIIEERREDVLKACERHHLRACEVTTEGEWVALLAIKE